MANRAVPLLTYRQAKLAKKTIAVGRCSWTHSKSHCHIIRQLFQNFSIEDDC